jgi:hypothetical protein
MLIHPKLIGVKKSPSPSMYKNARTYLCNPAIAQNLWRTGAKKTLKHVIFKKVSCKLPVRLYIDPFLMILSHRFISPIAGW